MVSYEYQELFYKQHQTKDFLIVDANATITPVTGEAPTVSGATIEIHTADIESESFQLDESICSEDNLKFGLCESAKVEFTIKNKADIPNLKSSDYGDLLNIYLYFNGDSDTLFQIGQYVCYKDEYTSNRKLRNIELYDLNFTLNDLDITSWYNQYFSDGNRHQIIFVIADLFNWINKSGSYANDDSSPNIHIEIDPVYTLCNGAFPIGKTIESDTITFGFFMQGLLEFNGAFGHITREGKFKFLVMQSYDATPCRTVTDDFRKPPTNYSDDNTWGIGQIDVYGRNNEMKFTQQNTDKKKPSIYVMVDPWVIADRDAGDSYTNNAIRTLLITINHYNYNKSETECSGDLCIEVGDRYNVEFTQTSEYDTRNWFRSYVLERHFKGIQSMHDTYTAKGDKKQPLYQITNDNWHIGDSSTATQGQGTGGVSELNDEHDRRLIEIMRNYGQPMLDEPTVELTYNKGDSQVEIKWTDPADITSYSPLPVEWAGTIVVRKEGSQPIHRWGTEHSAFGGTVLVDSTTRDEYSVTAYADDTIEPNKRYYYAIMPYFVALDDEQHPIKHYRWTKVFSVDTARILVAPTLFPIQETGIEGVDVTVAYAIPVLEVGQYEVIKLVAKKDSIPLSIADGDKAIDLTPTPGMIVNTATMTGLDELSHYYFVIFIEDELGNTATSEPMDCETGEDLGWRFINILNYNSCQVSVDLLDSFYDTDTTTPIYQTGGFSGEVINPIAQGYYGDEAYFGARCYSVDYSDGMRANGMMYYMETGTSWNIIEQSIPTDGGLIFALNVDGRCFIGTLAHSSNSASPYSRFTLIRKANGVNTDLYQALIKSEQFPDDWEQVVFDANVFKDTLGNNYQGTIVDTDCCSHAYVIRRYDDENIAFINQYMTGDMSDSEYFPTTKTEIYRNGDYYITILRESWTSPGYPVNWRFGKDGEQEVLAFSVGGNGSYRSKFKVAIAINRKEHRGKFIFGDLSVGNYYGGVVPQSSGLDYKHTDINMYNWLINSGMVQEE